MRWFTPPPYYQCWKQVSFVWECNIDVGGRGESHFQLITRVYLAIFVFSKINYTYFIVLPQYFTDDCSKIWTINILNSKHLELSTWPLHLSGHCVLQSRLLTPNTKCLSPFILTKKKLMHIKESNLIKLN